MASLKSALSQEMESVMKMYAKRVDEITNEYVSSYETAYLDKGASKEVKQENESIFVELHKEMMLSRMRGVERYLKGILKDDSIPPRLSEAMRYSLLAGGKRLRPILSLTCARLCGSLCKYLSFGFASASPSTWTAVFPFAAGLEMIHTYSLIHDDLPAMDDDNLRRGKLTCHKEYDEATAILAGDGLLTDAFYFMTQCDIPAENMLRAISHVSLAAGSQGMVGGQMLDLAAEDREITHEELTLLNAKKTGALIRASCVSGAILTGANVHIVSAISAYASAIGIAFQITDDILDVEGDTALLGKPVGSDESNKKSTWVTLMGIEKSKKEAQKYVTEAVDVLETLYCNLKNELHLEGANEVLFEIRFLQKVAQDILNRVS